MKITVQTSRGPVRFHSVGEPIAGIPAQAAQHTPCAEYLDYASGKLGLIPAFGDSIGKHVNKAELALCKRYVDYAKSEHAALLAEKAELLAALELAVSEIDWHKANAGLVLRGMGDHNIDQARAAIAKAKGVQS